MNNKMDEVFQDLHEVSEAETYLIFNDTHIFTPVVNLLGFISQCQASDPRPEGPAPAQSRESQEIINLCSRDFDSNPIASPLSTIRAFHNITGIPDPAAKQAEDAPHDLNHEVGERMSIKDKPSVNPRRTETIARERIISTLLEIMDLTTSKDPHCWELAAIHLDEAADVARIAEKSLALRQEQADLDGVTLPTPWRPSTPPHVHEFLKDYLASSAHRPDACQVVSIPAGSNIGQILLAAMVKGAHR